MCKHCHFHEWKHTGVVTVKSKYPYDVHTIFENRLGDFRYCDCGKWQEHVTEFEFDGWLDCEKPEIVSRG